MAFDDNFVEPGERDQRYDRAKIETNVFEFDHRFKDQTIEVHRIPEDDFEDFSEFEDSEFNVVVLSPSIADRFKEKPAKMSGDILEEANKYKELSLDAQRTTKSDGTLMIHHAPLILPKIAMGLNKADRKFRYWISLERPTDEEYPIKHTHEGILMYFMNENNFNYNRIREPHDKCKVCNNYLSDWGGKKDQMNDNGNVISDIWSEISFEDYKNNTKLPIKALDRLLDLVTDDDFKVLLAPYEGDLQ